ncbi:MAG: hypothetical protein RMX97_12595 [Nostoc sp. DedQUE11]|nr:hypothetical protein [Nostoc sp. DedQUE11]
MLVEISLIFAILKSIYISAYESQETLLKIELRSQCNNYAVKDLIDGHQENLSRREF